VIPDEPKSAAQTEKWVSLINTQIDPIMVRQYLLNWVFPKGPDGQPDRKAIDAVLPQMQNQINVLDRAVSTSGHLAGNGFTLADIDLLPILYYVQKFPEGEMMVKGAKNLIGYFAKHSERPCFKATIPPPLPSR
jgi:glutathione S-transferase